MAAANMNPIPNRRVLVIDDNQAIHGDFRKILCSDDGKSAELNNALTAIFDEAPEQAAQGGFEVDFASQGQAGHAKVQQALADGAPYAMAFVDMRMPPGWDGVETIEHLWEAAPELQVVICTALSDYRWEHVLQRLGQSDRLLILRKPFDNIEVWQLANALTSKWDLQRQARAHSDELEQEVAARTSELQMLNAHLEERVEERTDHIGRLLRQEKEFIVKLGHDLRTPLTPLTALLPIVAAAETDADRRECFDICLDQVEILRHLAECVSVLGEMDVPNAPIERYPVGLRAAAEAALDAVVSAGCGERGRVVVEIPDELRIQGEPGYLQSMIGELLNNAFRFSPSGTRVTVAAESRGNCALLSVADQGRGLTGEQLVRAFDAFYTGDSARHDGHANGLGLALCLRIVERHGGRIWAESAGPGSGATFRLTLPLAVAPVGSRAAISSRELLPA